MSTKSSRFALLVAGSLAVLAVRPAGAAIGVGFVSPQPGQVFPEFSSVVLQATSAPVTSIAFVIGNAMYFAGRDTLATSPIFFREGSYTAEVRVIYRVSNANVRVTSSVPFRVESYWATSSVPYLSLAAEPGGTNVAAGYGVTFTAEAEDNTGLDRVEFWGDGALVAAGVSNASITHPRWTGTWNHIPAGNHSVWAVAYDREGFVATSTVIRFTAVGFDALLPVSDGFVARSSTPWESYYGFEGDATYLASDYVSGNWSGSDHAILEFDLSGRSTGRYVLALSPLAAESYVDATIRTDLLVQRGNGVAELSDYYLVTPVGTNGAGTATLNGQLTFVETMSFPERRYVGTQVFSSEHLGDAINTAITEGWGRITIVLRAATEGNVTFASLENPTFAPPQLIRLRDPEPPADVDQDQDGLTDRQEQIAGTNPQDPLSRFSAEPAECTGNGPRVTFERLPGRVYKVQRCADLRAAAWETIFTDGPGDQASVTVEDPTPADNVYYRVTVELYTGP